MDWVLFVILASISGSEKTINSTAVPMATEQLCNAAKEKLTQAYQKTQTPNFGLVAECLRDFPSFLAYGRWAASTSSVAVPTAAD
jgi:hypothetical protein